jgi:UDP-N-acetylmuramate dehydrogenase
MNLIDYLPNVRGKYKSNASLAKLNWFGVGGSAEVLFRPYDLKDLTQFLQNVKSDIPLTIIGAGSNILVREGGIDGVVIKLGGAFAKIELINEKQIRVGSAALSYNVAMFCRDNGVGNLEFLVGIPGSVGGNIAMNAGAYGNDISNVLISCRAVDGKGKLHEFSNQDMKFSYRTSGLPAGYILIDAVIEGVVAKREEIASKIEAINTERNQTQPVRTKTSGSTFKNPVGNKAWQLIDKAGCRGLRKGGALVSEKHCNFFINEGNATAIDIEELGEEVRAKVKADSGVELQWEVRIIGKHKQ